MITKYLLKAQETYRKEGMKNTFKKTGKYILLIFYRHAVMWEKLLDSSSTVDSVDSGLLDVRAASKQDIDEEYLDKWHSKEEAVKRLNKGHLLFLAKEEGRNIFYGWIELANVSIPWLGIQDISIPSNIGYVSGLYVPEQNRGRRLSFKAGTLIIKHLLKNTSVGRLFCVTAPDNSASNPLFLHLGFHPYQHLRYFNILGFKIYIVTAAKNAGGCVKKVFINSKNFWNFFSLLLKL
jgi:RimJ/RimL family protein N-acetyltransferase